MPRRRPNPAHADQPQWLTVADELRRLLHCQRLPAGTDPRQALEREVHKWALEGWRIDGDAAYGFCFIQRGGERRLVKVCLSDPAGPPHAGHAFLAGAGSHRSDGVS